MPYNLRVGCKSQSSGKRSPQMHYQGVFATMGYLRRKKGYNIRTNIKVPKSGIHLTYAGSRADVDYKLLHHGESGQILAMKATAKGSRVNFCKVDQKTVDQMEQLFRDNPVSVARAWERKSSVLRKDPPSASELAKCQVPWALLVHPERYPDFWGARPQPYNTDTMKATRKLLRAVAELHSPQLLLLKPPGCQRSRPAPDARSPR
eukprot:symbB.v1.2.024136.t1/scaffold2263.1/size84088/5